MARYRVTAPVKHVHGAVAGLVFVESVAETDSTRALAYFRRHGYRIDEIPQPQPVPQEETPAAPQPEAQPKKRSKRAADDSPAGDTTPADTTKEPS